MSAAPLLGDSRGRDYSRKLGQFNAFAAPELERLVASLGPRPGMRVLDAGCGTGEALQRLAAAAGPSGTVHGWDLSAAHIAAARRFACDRIRLECCDLLEAAPPEPPVDYIWCVNTLNHFANPAHAARHLMTLLAPGGLLAVGQSSFLPDMMFAWDARLERLVNEAVRRYYRDKYALAEQDLAGVRALVGTLRGAGFDAVLPHSILIERTSPLDEATERYLADAIFASTWGPRLERYLAPSDYAALARLCDPADPAYALRRPDFHFLQTFTLVTARRP